MASANWFTRSWVISNQSLVPSVVPTAARTSSSDSNTVCAMGFSGVSIVLSDLSVDVTGEV